MKIVKHFNEAECEQIMEETQENSSLQIKESKALENDEEKNEKNLELLHSQRKQLRWHDMNVLYWSSLFCE
jgi:hypothetical protein